jgi:hypothetical protein
LNRQAGEAALLAAFVLALAIGATHVFPAFALPLLAGGVCVAGLAVRAFWRHWELLDRLLLDRDAYVISEVRASAGGWRRWNGGTYWRYPFAAVSASRSSPVSSERPPSPRN